MQIAETNHQIYHERLWKCWAWHWRSAIDAKHNDGNEARTVADRIRSGRGYTGKGNLGGDPLGDVVLAVAVCEGDERAIRRLGSQYADLAIGVARKFSPRTVEDETAWWDTFVTTNLADFERGTGGALSKYSGRCALKYWLPTVVKNYVRSLQKTRAELSLSDDDDHILRGRAAPAEPGAEERDCQRLLGELVSAGLDALSHREQAVLRAIFYEERVQKEIARNMGIGQGRLSHIKADATRRRLEAMHKSAAETDRRGGFDDCLELIFKQRNVAYFGDVLMRALKGLGEADS